MEKIVIIAEKPSMKKKYEGAIKGVKVTSSIGHISELQSPEYYLKKSKIFWNELVRFFPLIPDKYEYRITNAEQYNRIKEIVKDADEICLACDPDREGELIHRNILELLQNDGSVKAKKISRIWLNAETKSAINKAFETRKDYTEYEGYYKAARIRSIIDWLVGIQLTVLYTVKYGKPGQPISIGRVQSWLLSEIVRRTEQFNNFIPKEYWTIQFITKDNVKLNLINSDNKIHFIYSEEEFKNTISATKNKDITLTVVEKKPFTEYAPSLYDLTSLQKDASKHYNISPDDTLKIAQSLYETHELISYPRTDCNVLSTEEAKEIKNSLELINRFPEYKEMVEAVKKENENIELNKKYIGDIKGHFAIIPVFNYDKKNIPALNANEKKIFDLIVKRFIGALLPPVKGDKTKITGNIDIYRFGAEIKNITDYGYKKYLRAEEDEKEETVAVNYNVGDVISGKITNKKEKTKPEPLLKDESIMALMEKAHLLIKDEKLKEYLKGAKGIGTAATRASFIPILLNRGYITKEKGNYIPLQKGYDVYNVLPEEIKYADYSAKLEYELSNFIDGKGREENIIINETKEFLKSIFNKVNGSKYAFKAQSYGKCPKCGADVIKGRTGYGCTNYITKTCDFYFSQEIGSKVLTVKNVSDILNNHTTDLIKGFKSTKEIGKLLDGYLILNEDFKVRFSFEKKEADNTKTAKSRE